MDKDPPIVEVPPICEAPPTGGSTHRQTPANGTWLENMRGGALEHLPCPWSLHPAGNFPEAAPTCIQRTLISSFSVVAKNKVAGVL